MASVWPAKNNYATGDVLTAANMNGVGDDLNDVYNFSGYAAGKNKIINGDFGINQRNFSSTTTSYDYGFDRFKIICNDGTSTYSAQTFTAGTAPVAGYEAKNFAQIATTGQTAAGAYTFLQQPIESARTYAGQTVVLSFWAKSSSGTPKIFAELAQYFGSGGSPSSEVDTALGSVTLSTSWARYSLTVANPSISGKTFGTNNDDALLVNFWTSAGSNFNARTNSLGIQTATIQIWGVQLEAGSTASPFQTATGTKQGELAACQRYYFRNTPGSTYGAVVSSGVIYNTTTCYTAIQLPVQMRGTPSSLEWANLQIFDSGNTTYAVTVVSLSSIISGPLLAGVEFNAVGLTAGRPAVVRNANNTAGYLAFNAEL